MSHCVSLYWGGFRLQASKQASNRHRPRGGRCRGASGNRTVREGALRAATFSDRPAPVVVLPVVLRW